MAFRLKSGVRKKEDYMLAVLEFIFQDFWHWAGALVLVSVIVSPLGGALISCNINSSKNTQKEEISNDCKS